MPPVIWMLVILISVFSLITPEYFSLSNMANVLLQSSPLMILAFGQTLIILTQGTDLSLGAQVSFVTVIWIFMAQMGINMYAAAGISVLLTVTVGALNGLIVAKGKIPPFIATLGMQ
ncbi:MAG: ABC transporter permease, partial [Treponemataceae bacterium]